MKLIKQPRNSKYCGDCAMAMILDTTMEKVIAEIDRHENGGTTIHGYYKMLAEKDIEFTAKEWMDNRKRIDLDGKGIVSITDRNRNWGHAVAFEDGKVYDPGGWEFEDLAAMKKHYKQMHGMAVKVYCVIKVMA